MDVESYHILSIFIHLNIPHTILYPFYILYVGYIVCIKLFYILYVGYIVCIKLYVEYNFIHTIYQHTIYRTILYIQNIPHTIYRIVCGIFRWMNIEYINGLGCLLECNPTS